MIEERVSLRYARAIFELAVEQKIAKEVYDDFVLIDETVRKSHELNVFIENPVIKPHKKKAVFEEMFKDKLNQSTLKLLYTITEKGREILLPSISRQYEKIYNEAFNRLPVNIVTASELDAQHKEQLVKKLADAFQKEILPTFTVDKSIIGGIKFLVADKIIDSSVKNKLDKLKHDMVFN